MKKSMKMMLLLAMMLVAHAAKAQVVFSTFKLKPTILYTSKALHVSFTCDGEKKVKVSFDEIQADLDGDGYVTLKDAAKLIRLISGR